MITINLEASKKKPLYEQIYTHIKEEIRSGHLEKHTKLPSTRGLASHLQVSRNTVDLAYAQLLSEGYIESIEKKGYYVTEVTDFLSPVHSSAPSLPLSEQVLPSYRYDFSPFAIDITNFPFHTWKVLTKQCLDTKENDLFLLGSNQGDLPLRHAIQNYLHSSRGVNCSYEQIIIGAGTDYLLQLLIQILEYKYSAQQHPLSIGMENPVYKKAYHIFSGFKWNILPLLLDEEGINVEMLSSTSANLVYVTPSHQYPLGIVMPIKRRMELLSWANDSDQRYILEDDHDSEFRYKGKPIPALQGLDCNDKVIYLGTFSRSIAPAIRIGYMVLPKSLFAIYKENLHYYSSTVSRIDQAIITRFLKDGYFERHLNRMRKIYKSKHDLLLQTLRPLKKKITILGEQAGLHLVIRIHTSHTEEAIVALAKEKQIHLKGLKEYYIAPTSQSLFPHVLLGYANLTEDEIKEGAAQLYQFILELCS